MKRERIRIELKMLCMALAALAVMAVVIPIISAELPTEGPNYDLNQQVAWGNWFRANNPNQTQNNPTGHNANYPGAILATFRLSGVIYETDTCASCHSGTYGGGQLNNYGMAFAQNPEHAANPVKVLQSLGAPPGFVDIAQAVNNPNCQQVWYSSPLYPQYVCSGQPNSAQQGQQITQQQQQQLEQQNVQSVITTMIYRTVFLSALYPNYTPEGATFKLGKIISGMQQTYNGEISEEGMKQLEMDIVIACTVCHSKTQEGALTLTDYGNRFMNQSNHKANPLPALIAAGDPSDSS